MMPSYRLFSFDGAGKITGAERLDATDDHWAIEAARALKLGVRCEIWDRERLIARVDNRSFG